MNRLTSILINMAGAGDGSFQHLRDFEDINTMIKSLHVEATMFYFPVKRILKKESVLDKLIPSGKADGTSDNKADKEAAKGLQYHDILQQKLDHIISLNNSLIVDLKQDLNNEKISNQRFLPILGMLVKLHRSQLELISLEFSESKNRILKGIQLLGMDDQNLSDKANKIIQITRAILEKLKEVVVFGGSHRRYHRRDLQHIESVYTLNSERILLYKLFMMGGEEVLPDNLEDLTIEIF